MWSKLDEVRKSTLSPKAETIGKVLALLMGAMLVFDVAFATCLSFVPGFARYFLWAHWNQ